VVAVSSLRFLLQCRVELFLGAACAVMDAGFEHLGSGDSVPPTWPAAGPETAGVIEWRDG